MCDSASHDALRRNPEAWAQLKYVGIQDTFDGEGTVLEMRDCPHCHSTLCLPIPGTAVPTEVEDEPTSPIAYETLSECADRWCAELAAANESHIDSTHWRLSCALMRKETPR